MNTTITPIGLVSTLKIVSKSLEVSSRSRSELINITYQIRDIIAKEAYKEGIVVIFVKHTTCGVLVNEAEKGLLTDILNYFSKQVPYNEGYVHDKIDTNADSHLKSILTGNSIAVPISDGDLSLGTWQSILLYELDGPRTRTVNLTFIVD